MDHELTDEQLDIINLVQHTDQNILINALAGCGKTSTLELIERASEVKPILYLVFNKKNAEEAKTRMLSTTSVKSFNAFGHGIWAGTTGKRLALDKDKTKAIFKSVIDASPKNVRDTMWECYWPTLQGVAMAKALGYVPEGKFPNAKRLISQSAFHKSLEESPDDLTADLIDAVLSESIAQAYKGSIDFNDQVYMPAVFGGPFPNFPLTMVDEKQDMSPVNHALLERTAKKRLIGVGDRWQNIYGFRGAKGQGMEEAKVRYNMTEADLSVSFRCPKAVVLAAQWRVPHFKWLKEGGHVEQLDKLNASTLGDDAVFICRNNAPLFSAAIRMLSLGRSVSVSGSDIGPKLIGIMRRLGDDSMNRAEVRSAIADWLDEKLSRESKTAQDMADCMKVFADHGSNLSQAISYAEHLFSQRGTIQFLTGHKSKGLEFDTVYHLDPWLCREDEQDKNLRYVITTRSKDKLFEIDSRNILWH